MSESESENSTGMSVLIALGILSGSGFLIALSAEALQLFLRGGADMVAAGLMGICIEAWIFDYISLFLAILLFWALLNRIIAGCILTALLAWIFAFANALKYKAVGKSLVMSDFALAGDVFSVWSGVVSANVGIFVVMGGLLLLGISIIALILRHKPLFPLRPKGRFGIIIILGLQFIFGMNVSSRTGTTGIFFRDETVNGFLMNFLRSSRHAFRCPEGYGREAVESILVRHDSAERAAQKPAAAKVPPDVLVYVGESFFDTKRLRNAAFDVDPTPNFHHIISSEGVLAGHLTSPERGGTTANVEFELMTGMPLAVFQESTVPYHSEVFRPLDALPALFGRSGATHPLAVHNSYK